ncbi:MAG: TRAP transporter small permease subunit [Burkholderiaceae bacterium]
MGFLLRLAGIFDSIARNAGRYASWVILPLIFMIMFDVVTRKLDVTRLWFSDLSIQWGGISVSTIFQDTQWHFHAILMMMTFAIGYLANAHVRVDIFRELLSKRKQAWVELVGLIVLAIPFVVVMINEAWQLTELAYSQGEGSESLTGIGKRWIIKSVVLIGFTLLLLAILATLLRLIAMIFGTDAERKEANAGLAIFPEDAGDLEAARLAAERALEEDEIDAAELAEKLAQERKK